MAYHHGVRPSVDAAFSSDPYAGFKTKDYGYCTETGNYLHTRPSAQPAAQARIHMQGRDGKVKTRFCS